MHQLGAYKKQLSLMAAVNATRAARDLIEEIVIEGKGKLAEPDGMMTKRDFRKVLSSIEQIGKTMSLTSEVSTSAVGHYAKQVQNRMSAAKRREDPVHRTPEKTRNKQMYKQQGSLEWHHENLTRLRGEENTSFSKKSRNMRRLGSRARLKVRTPIRFLPHDLFLI